MTGQSTAAAERSAHVARGPSQHADDTLLTEVAPGQFKLACLARAERDRDDAIAARDIAIRDAAAWARQSGWWQGIAEGKDILIQQLQAERDRLRAALVRLRDCDWVRRPGDRMDPVRDIARAALAEPDDRDG